MDSRTQRGRRSVKLSTHVALFGAMWISLTSAKGSRTLGPAKALPHVPTADSGIYTDATAVSMMHRSTTPRLRSL